MKDTKERGITLISLIITVIIMLILAGIGLNFTFGEHGLFKKTEEAAKMHTNATNEEENALNELEKEFDRIKDKIDKEKNFSINFINEFTGEIIIRKCLA